MSTKCNFVLLESVVLYIVQQPFLMGFIQVLSTRLSRTNLISLEIQFSVFFSKGRILVCQQQNQLSALTLLLHGSLSIPFICGLTSCIYLATGWCYCWFALNIIFSAELYYKLHVTLNFLSHFIINKNG